MDHGEQDDRARIFYPVPELEPESESKVLAGLCTLAKNDEIEACVSTLPHTSGVTRGRRPNAARGMKGRIRLSDPTYPPVAGSTFDVSSLGEPSSGFGAVTSTFSDSPEPYDDVFSMVLFGLDS